MLHRFRHAILALLLLTTPAVAAVCGSADDTQAVNALLASGGNVLLPPGRCTVSDTLVVPAGTDLRGAGQGKTVILWVPGADAPTMRIDGDNVHVSALTIDGGAGEKNEKAPGLFVRSGVHHVRIDGIEVTRAGANGIKVSGSDVDVAGNSVHDNWISGIYVVGRLNKQNEPVPRAENVRIVGNLVAHNVLGRSRTGRPGDGIDIDRMTSNCLVQNNRVVGNDIILFENGAQQDSAGSSRSGGHAIDANIITDSEANGIDVAGAISDFTITGNTIRHVQGFGIVVNGPASNGAIRNNHIDGVEKNAILVDNYIQRKFPNLSGRPEKLTISGNTVGRAGAPITVRTPSPDITVSDNTSQ